MVITHLPNTEYWRAHRLWWSALVISLVTHAGGMFFMLKDFSIGYTPPVFSGAINVVLQSTPQVKQQVKPQPKPQPKKAKPEPVKRRITKKAKPKPLPKPVSHEKVQAEVTPLEPVAQTEETIAEQEEPPTPALTSYVPPSSDADYLSNPKPAYPRAARRRGMQGVVLLNVEVSMSGAPVQVMVKNSSGFKVLDIAAKETVKRWRFIPAYRNGEPVTATVEVPIKFVLSDAGG